MALSVTSYDTAVVSNNTQMKEIRDQKNTAHSFKNEQIIFLTLATCQLR